MKGPLAADGPFTDRLPRADRPGERPAPAGLGLHPPAARARAATARLEAAGYLAPEHRTYLAGVTRRSPPWASTASSTATRPSTGRARSPSSEGLDVLSVPSPYAAAQGAVPARGACHRRPGASQPGTGPFPRLLERTGGGLLFEPGTCPPGGPPARALPATPSAARNSAARARGVRAPLLRRAHGRAHARDLRRGQSRVRGRLMLSALGVSKSYPTPRGPLPVLEDVSFTLGAGESLCVVGPSGSGKSTLLYILGTLERPSAGLGARRGPRRARARRGRARGVPQPRDRASCSRTTSCCRS